MHGCSVDRAGPVYVPKRTLSRESEPEKQVERMPGEMPDPMLGGIPGRQPGAIAHGPMKKPPAWARRLRGGGCMPRACSVRAAYFFQ
jgi:hypothetical protein